MTDLGDSLSCAEFQAQLADRIGAGENVSAHPHIRSCALCRALLTDLETIAEAARQLLPAVEPPDHLWKHIELAILGEKTTAGSR